MKYRRDIVQLLSTAESNPPPTGSHTSGKEFLSKSRENIQLGGGDEKPHSETHFPVLWVWPHAKSLRLLLSTKGSFQSLPLIIYSQRKFVL